MKKRIGFISVYSGIIAPILFVIIFTVEGLFRENYSAMTNFISELSLGNRGWIQITNFLLFGFLFFVFSLGLLLKFQKRKLSSTGPILFLIIASSYFISGLFVTDPETIFFKSKEHTRNYTWSFRRSCIFINANKFMDISKTIQNGRRV